MSFNDPNNKNNPFNNQAVVYNNNNHDDDDYPDSSKKTGTNLENNIASELTNMSNEQLQQFILNCQQALDKLDQSSQQDEITRSTNNMDLAKKLLASREPFNFNEFLRKLIVNPDNFRQQWFEETGRDALIIITAHVLLIAFILMLTAAVAVASHALWVIILLTIIAGVVLSFFYAQLYNRLANWVNEKFNADKNKQNTLSAEAIAQILIFIGFAVVLGFSGLLTISNPFLLAAFILAFIASAIRLVKIILTKNRARSGQDKLALTIVSGIANVIMPLFVLITASIVVGLAFLSPGTVPLIAIIAAVVVANLAIYHLLRVLFQNSERAKRFADNLKKLLFSTEALVILMLGIVTLSCLFMLGLITIHNPILILAVLVLFFGAMLFFAYASQGLCEQFRNWCVNTFGKQGSENRSVVEGVRIAIALVFGVFMAVVLFTNPLVSLPLAAILVAAFFGMLLVRGLVMLLNNGASQANTLQKTCINVVKFLTAFALVAIPTILVLVLIVNPVSLTALAAIFIPTLVVYCGMIYTAYLYNILENLKGFFAKVEKVFNLGPKNPSAHQQELVVNQELVVKDNKKIPVGYNLNNHIYNKKRSTNPFDVSGDENDQVNNNDNSQVVDNQL